MCLQCPSSVLPEAGVWLHPKRFVLLRCRDTTDGDAMFTTQSMQTATAHGEFLLYPKYPAYGAVRGNAPQVLTVFGYGQSKDLHDAVDLTCFVNETGLCVMFMLPMDPKIWYAIATYCPCLYKDREVTLCGMCRTTQICNPRHGRLEHQRRLQLHPV